MKSIHVNHPEYKNIVAQSLTGGESITWPFYIADDDGMVVVISEDLNTVLNECEASMLIDEESNDNFYYDMRTEWEIQEKQARNKEIVEIITAEDGQYELV